MTVNELLQKLVELARDGKGQWPVQIRSGWDETWEIVKVEVKEEGEKIIL